MVASSHLAGGRAPISLDVALASPDHESLLLLGRRIVAGHEGSPSFHRAVPLAAELRGTSDPPAAPARGPTRDVRSD